MRYTSFAFTCLQLALAIASMPVMAGSGRTPLIDSEYQALPAYCTLSKQRLSGDKAASEMGFAQYGEQFRDVQHLCWGIGFLNRYYRYSNSVDLFGHPPESNLNNAMAEFNYMVNNLSENSAFGMDIFLYRGILFAIRKQYAKAMIDFRKSLTYNPTNVKTYNAMASIYENQNQKSEALKVITEGLRYIPDSKSLKRRYVEMGGKLPYPDPIVAKVPESRGNEAPASGKQDEKTGGTATTEKPAVEPVVAATEKPTQPAVPEVASDSAASKPSPNADSSAEAEKAKANDARKPWCRFCPE